MPFMQVQQFLLVGGISEKNFVEFKSNIKINSSWLLSRMDPLLNLLCKTCLPYFKWQGEDNNKEGCAIFKKYHSDKSHNVTSIGFIIFAPAYDLIIEHCCVELKACGDDTRLELCCHHSGWDIVLQAYAAQMGKCCDPLESGMSTSMYSSGFCLLSSNTIMLIIYDGEPFTWKIHQTSQEI